MLQRFEGSGFRCEGGSGLGISVSAEQSREHQSLHELNVLSLQVAARAKLRTALELSFRAKRGISTSEAALRLEIPRFARDDDSLRVGAPIPVATHTRVERHKCNETSTSRQPERE